MTDDLFTPTTHPNLGAPKPKCRRHDWVTLGRDGRHFILAARRPGIAEVWRWHTCERLGCFDDDAVPPTTCARCGAIRDEARARRGRRNRARGLRIQREANRALGVTNLAGNKPGHDGGLHNEPFATESKSGGAFSERVWRWLRAIPAEAGQTRVLIVTEAPGPGHKARSYVVVERGDWRDLHGEGR